jgi:hypothetical protein
VPSGFQNHRRRYALPPSVSRGQLEHATRALSSNPEAPWLNIANDVENDSAAIDEQYVDPNAHSQGMNRRTAIEPHCLVLVDARASEKPDRLRRERVGPNESRDEHAAGSSVAEFPGHLPAKS